MAAEYGLPCGVMPMPMAAGTSPATMAGTLVVHNAEALSGIVLLQLASPGVPCFVSAAPTVIDLTTGGYTGGGAEDYILATACCELAHFYGLPIAMGTMATGAKEPDWQAAVDDSLSTFASVMGHADMMNGAGLLNGSKILSYPHMVMETEIYRIVKRMAGGLVVDDDTLALDVIKAVGQGGTYLTEKHTRDHMRELWRPRVWDREPYESWLQGGRRGALEKATEIADEILAAHVPEPLPEDVAAELSRIVARADAELAGGDGRGSGGRDGRATCAVAGAAGAARPERRRCAACACGRAGAARRGGGRGAGRRAGRAGSFVLAGRVPERDVRLGGAGLLLATGGPAPRVRPLGGGDPLPATPPTWAASCVWPTRCPRSRSSPGRRCVQPARPPSATWRCVWLRRPSTWARWRGVMLGLRGSKDVEVTQGLSAGEQIVRLIEGQKQPITDGQRIAAK